MASYSRPLLFMYRIMVGLKAWVVQTYIEANVKNGLQFESSFDFPAVPANGSRVVAFRTTSKKVIIKARVINFTGPKVTARVYKGGVITETTNQDDIFNLSDINPKPATAELFANATVTTQGNEIGAPNFIYGSETVGGRSQGSFGVQGVERNLNDNQLYYLIVTNNDAANPRSFSVYLTWYEGTPDLPVIEGQI